MYGNLGNKHNQDVIRNLNPDPKDRLIHCKLLRENPSACDDVPIGDGNRGICPSNPHHPDNVAKRNVLIAESPSVISKESAEYLESVGRQTDALLDMGLVSDLSQLSPSEYILGWYYRRLRFAQDAEVQAKYIISELAKAMNKKN